MSHTIQRATTGDIPALLQVTIVNYTAGGEAFVPITDFGLNPPFAIFFAQVAPAQNSLGVVLLPALIAGKVMLFRVSAGVISEIPTTAGLNAVVSAIYYC